MTFQFEKKLADAFQAVRPPEQLVQKTEQSMHAALHRQQKKQPPRIVRYAASAACAAAGCIVPRAAPVQTPKQGPPGNG